MQSSQSTEGQIAAAIARATAGHTAPRKPTPISHGHEEGEAAPVVSTGTVLDQLTGKARPDGGETAADPS